MNFHELLAKMQQLDQPVPEAQTNEASIEECGEMPPAPMGMDQHRDTPPPSMSVNLNAQGLDDIAELMKLMTKVNPDMINQKEPLNAMPHSAEIEPGNMPSLTPPGPSISSIGDLGNLDKGPLKMLPDLDHDDEHGEEPKTIDLDVDDKEGPGPDGSPEHEGPEGEKPEPEEKEEEGAYGNSAPGGAEPEEKDTDFMINKLAGGMNRPKGQHKHSYQAGDNPMAMPEGDLRAAIRAELLQRLAEAKGAK
jgi:hypothetical protein